jgi:hypothetical protein
MRSGWLLKSVEVFLVYGCLEPSVLPVGVHLLAERPNRN